MNPPPTPGPHLDEDLLSLAEGDASLDPARRAQAEAHLAACPACARALADTRLVLATVDGPLAPPAPSPGFDRALFARLDAIDREQAEAARGPTLLERVRELFTLPRLGLAAAAAAVAIAVLARGPGMPAPGAPVDADALAVAEDLELYELMDVVEDLDVLEDLEVIESLEDGEPG